MKTIIVRIRLDITYFKHMHIHTVRQDRFFDLFSKFSDLSFLFSSVFFPLFCWIQFSLSALSLVLLCASCFHWRLFFVPDPSLLLFKVLMLVQELEDRESCWEEVKKKNPSVTQIRNFVYMKTTLTE